MKKIVINGGKTLTGTINISGAKNSVVALIPAAILTSEKVKISNVPNLSDTENLKKIINLLGGQIEFSPGNLLIDSSKLQNSVIPEELSEKLRASYYFMGALLGRFHHVEIYFPGGCKIGSRPIDLHIKSFEKMGTTVKKIDNKYILDAPNLHGADIDLRFPSVGATVNILLAAVLADGRTTINNAACEPEIVNIAELLKKMGANISGEGTKTIKIKGVKTLHGATVKTIPDRIEAGTYIMIGALAGKNLVIKNTLPDHLTSLIDLLKKMGVEMDVCCDSITLGKTEILKPVNVKTEVYPGFPTDLGQPMSVLLTQAHGKCKFEETIYEKRTGHFSELVKMGANIKYTDTKADIEGPAKLKGESVSASDLRAGAALIIAGLIANGKTKIFNIEYILRGYEDIVEKLSNVGADIEIIDD